MFFLGTQPCKISCCCSWMVYCVTQAFYRSALQEFEQFEQFRETEEQQDRNSQNGINNTVKIYII
jgi:hypothetical protein